MDKDERMRLGVIFALCTVILFIVVFGIVVSYGLGKSNCECNYGSAFDLEGVKDDQLITNYLNLEDHRIHGLCLVLISSGIAIGLIFHGFPFRFDFRRSTVYNEYSEDDDLGDDDLGDDE